MSKTSKATKGNNKREETFNFDLVNADPVFPEFQIAEMARKVLAERHNIDLSHREAIIKIAHVYNKCAAEYLGRDDVLDETKVRIINTFNITNLSSDSQK